MDLVPLTDEHRAIVDLCRAFGAAEIRPAARAVDEADIETPWELWRKAARAGIAAFMLPAEYGGGGYTDVFTQCLAQEELSAADAGIANLLTSGGFFADPVLALGTEAQKQRWLRPLTTDDPPMTALAVTEPGVGSDSAAVTTRATRVPGGYRLTGQKTWISNGGVAELAASATGLARACLELATSYARERRQFGRPIIEHQAVAFRLADVATRVDAARLLTWRAAKVLDAGGNGGGDATVASAKAKLYASETAMFASWAAVQTLGGNGYSREFLAEKWMRDAKLEEIEEGTSDIQRLIIGRSLR